MLRTAVKKQKQVATFGQQLQEGYLRLVRAVVRRMTDTNPERLETEMTLLTMKAREEHKTLQQDAPEKRGIPSTPFKKTDAVLHRIALEQRGTVSSATFDVMQQRLQNTLKKRRDEGAQGDPLRNVFTELTPPVEKDAGIPELVEGLKFVTNVKHSMENRQRRLDLFFKNTQEYLLSGAPVACVVQHGTINLDKLNELAAVVGKLEPKFFEGTQVKPEQFARQINCLKETIECAKKMRKITWVLFLAHLQLGLPDATATSALPDATATSALPDATATSARHDDNFNLQQSIEKMQEPTTDEVWEKLKKLFSKDSVERKKLIEEIIWSKKKEEVAAKVAAALDARNAAEVRPTARETSITIFSPNDSEASHRDETTGACANDRPPTPTSP